jgi:hypothetical protein
MYVDMNIKNNKKIIGRLEYISFPDFGIKDIVAKIDTGAYTASIDAYEIKEITDSENIPVLHFKLLNKSHINVKERYGEYYTHDFYKKKVKSSDGNVQNRYVIRCRFNLGQNNFSGHFTLADRKDMRYPVLLGRKIIKNNFLVDVSKTFLLKK